MIKQLLIKTTNQKILAFFSDFPEQSFHEREIVRQTKLGKGQANKALNELYKNSVLNREQKGKMFFYSLNQENPVVKQFRILKTILDLEPLIATLKSLSKRVILYGSRATGKNLTESDLDLFVVSNNKDEIFRAIREFEEEQKFQTEIKAVIRNSAEWLSLEKKEPVYFNELLKGITLWEKPIDESRL